MIITGFDLETTGLDPKKDKIIEVGAVLWDTMGDGMPLEIQSDFISLPDDVEITVDALKTHRITRDILKRHGVDLVQSLWDLDQMVDQSVAVLAHNGVNFDREFYRHECARHALEPRSMRKTWIDTTTDLPYDPEITTRKLTYLAAEHGFLNPFAHRAVFDVLTMLSIFQRYDHEKALALASEPMITLQSLVSYDDRQWAKDRGYRWKCLLHPSEDCRCKAKVWVKTMRESQATIEEREAPFKVRRIP